MSDARSYSTEPETQIVFATQAVVLLVWQYLCNLYLRRIPTFALVLQSD